MVTRNATFYDSGLSGALFAPLKGCACAAAILLALLLAKWIIDGVMAFHVWPAGNTQLERILSDDLKRIHTMESKDQGLQDFAIRVAKFFYDLLFRWTGIDEMGRKFASPESMSIPDSIVRKVYIAHYEMIQVAMLSTQLFGIRFALLLGFCPLFALVYLVGMADGLAQRLIRRARGGYESSSIYHRAKYFQLVLAAAMIGSSILFPASVDPRWFVLPGLACSVLLASIQWTFYKKYL